MSMSDLLDQQPPESTVFSHGGATDPSNGVDVPPGLSSRSPPPDISTLRIGGFRLKGHPGAFSPWQLPFSRVSLAVIDRLWSDLFQAPKR